MVEVDQETCIGCGSCVAVAPEIFELQDDGKSYVKEGKKDPEGDLKDKAEEAARICPVDAIKV